MIGAKHFTCDEVGCDRPQRSKGLCSGHYRKMRHDVTKAGAYERPVIVMRGSRSEVRSVIAAGRTARP